MGGRGRRVRGRGKTCEGKGRRVGGRGEMCEGKGETSGGKGGDEWREGGRRVEGRGETSGEMSRGNREACGEGGGKQGRGDSLALLPSPSFPTCLPGGGGGGGGYGGLLGKEMENGLKIETHTDTAPQYCYCCNVAVIIFCCCTREMFNPYSFQHQNTTKLQQ